MARERWVDLWEPAGWRHIFDNLRIIIWIWHGSCLSSMKVLAKIWMTDVSYIAKTGRRFSTLHCCYFGFSSTRNRIFFLFDSLQFLSEVKPQAWNELSKYIYERVMEAIWGNLIFCKKMNLFVVPSWGTRATAPIVIVSHLCDYAGVFM